MCEDLPTRPSGTNTKNRCPFHPRRLEYKIRKWRDTWCNKHVWPWNTKWSRQTLTEFCQDNALVIASTLFQQHKKQLYMWTSPDGQYWNQIDYILCSRRERSSIVTKARPGANCSSDYELLIAKFRLILKRIGKTTKPFRYDLNQIPYDYTVKVTNRFKGLDLIDRVPEELWMEVRNIVQEVVTKPLPRKRNSKRQNGCLRRPYK